MKKFWFNLNPNSFVWHKRNHSIIYNADTECSLLFENNTQINKITEQLLNLENLYCLELTKKEIDDYWLRPFIDKVIAASMGSLIEVKPGYVKPIVLPPILNLQSDIVRLKNDANLSGSKNIMTYLHEVSFYINCGIKKQEPNLQYYFQFPFNNVFSDILPLNKITNFLRRIKDFNISKINIHGENILSYPDLYQFVGKLDSMPLIKTFYLNLKHFPGNIKELNFLETEKCYLKLLADGRFDIDAVINANNYLRKTKIRAEWLFFISSEEEYEKVYTILREEKLESFEIRPFYNGENLHFFESNIYMTEEDLKHPGLCKREVFAHQVLNTYDFGKLIVMSDGKVYANPYHDPLGTIDDDIKELIYTEMEKGTSWRRIRDMKPCSDCVYQWLCPSPSNYELAIGKPNLCHVKPDVIEGSNSGGNEQSELLSGDT